MSVNNNKLKFFSSEKGITSLNNFRSPKEVYEELPDNEEIIKMTYESCINVYEREDQLKRQLESKAQNILGLVSLIIIITFGLTKLYTFFQNKPLSTGTIQFWLQPLIPSLFLAGLLSILFAAMFALLVVKLKQYKDPFEEVVCFDNRKSKSFTLLKIITAKLLIYISENRKFNGYKMDKLKFAHSCFTLGTVLLGFACIIFLFVYA